MLQTLSCVRAEMNLVWFLLLSDSKASIEANDKTVWQLSVEELQQGILHLVSERVGQFELSMEGQVDICQSDQIGKGIWVEREAVNFQKP